MAIKWEEPKIDWKSTDRFNFSDYNRIKNNISYIYRKATELNKPFDIEDMGEDINDYASFWNVIYFNAWENNIEALILDVDNTLLDTDKRMVDGLEKWHEEIVNAGIKTLILSNSNKKKKLVILYDIKRRKKRFTKSIKCNYWCQFNTTTRYINTNNISY